MPLKKLKIGVSACLLGMHCRYDGGTKLDARIVERLHGRVDFYPVCPETECGLPVPRDPMHLERSRNGTRLRVSATGEDVTMRMQGWADGKLEKIARADVAAFLLKSKSPSCALCSACVRDACGRVVTERGSGLFAAMLRRAFPNMILSEERDFDGFLKKLNLDVFRLD